MIFIADVNVAFDGKLLMQLNVSIIFECLRDVCEGISCRDSLRERPIRVFKPSISGSISDNCLYLVTQGSKEEAVVRNSSQKANVLYLGNMPQQLIQNGTNVIWAKASVDRKMIISRVIDIFDYYFSLEAELINALLEDKDITKITLLSNRFFEKQLFFWDSIGKFASTGKNDPHSEDSLMHAAAIESIISTSAKNANEQGPFFLSSGSEKLLCRNIFFGEDRMGTIAIREQGTFRNSEISILDYLGETLSRGMRHLKYETVYGTSFQKTVMQLLHGEQVNGSELGSILRKYGWSRNDCFRCAIVNINMEDSFSSELTSPLILLEKRVSYTHSHALTMVNSNHELIVLNDDTASDGFERCIQTIESMLTSAKISAQVGVGDCWSSIKGIDKSFWQATKALEIGSELQPDKTVHWYNDHLLHFIIEALSSSTGMGTVFVPHEIVRLMQHDRENNGNLLDTLLCYLENGRSKAPTIKELSIHKNTLNYRLRRIDEITGGLNVSDNDTAIAILLGIKILEGKAYSATDK